MTVKLKPIGAHLIFAVCSSMGGRIVRNYRKRMSCQYKILWMLSNTINQLTCAFFMLELFIDYGLAFTVHNK